MVSNFESGFNEKRVCVHRFTREIQFIEDRCGSVHIIWTSKGTSAVRGGILYFEPENNEKKECRKFRLNPSPYS